MPPLAWSVVAAAWQVAPMMFLACCMSQTQKMLGLRP
jgi:hypothetical protein